MRDLLVILLLPLDIALLYLAWHALPWLLAAALVLLGIAVAGWVVLIAVRLALRVVCRHG